MQRIKTSLTTALGVLSAITVKSAIAAMPLWSLTPATGSNTTQVISSNQTITLQYNVKNQSNRNKNLVILPTAGITQTAPCQLTPLGTTGSQCILNLSISGNALPAEGIHDGPVLCQSNTNGTPNPNQCYRPSAANSLNITRGSNGTPKLNIKPARLVVTENTTGTITLTNSSDIAVNNIQIVTQGNISIVASPTACGTSLGGNSTCTISITGSAVGNNNSVSITTSNSAPINFNVFVTQPGANTTLSFAATGTIPVTTTGALTSTFAITNNGTTNPATNVKITLPTTPAWIGVIEDFSNCDYILPNQSCNIVLSSTLPYIAQSQIQVTGDNISATTPSTTALAFTAQGYLIWEVDSSTRVQVVDSNDLTASQWGSTTIITHAYDPTNGSSSEDTLPAPNNGAGNTYLIYSNYPAIGASAGVECYNSTAGNAVIGTWYLPAICQLIGIGFNTTSCPTNPPNLLSNLNNLGFGGFANKMYWSSNENSGTTSEALGALFFTNGGGPGSSAKTGSNSVRCARALTIS